MARAELQAAPEAAGLTAQLLSLPVRYPRWTIAVVLAITAVFGLSARSITVNSAVENLLPEEDPDRVYYEEAKRTFGTDEVGVIGVFAPDVFTPATIAKIDRLSTRLAAIDGVREVISLTTVKGIDTDEYGAVRIGRLVRELPATREEAAALAAAVAAHPFYKGILASRDGTATGIVVRFENLTDEEFLRRDVEGRIRGLVAREAGPEEFAVSGIQTLKVSAARLMQEDLQRFLPLSLVLVVIILTAAFRTIRGVCLPLAAVLIGVVWTTGLMVMAGTAINMGTLVLPPLLMAIGIAYAIHIVSRYYQELAPGRSRPEVVRATLGEVGLPVAVAALTTLLGFATLAFNPIRAIRDLGVYSVFGISAILVVSLVFIPALLVVLPEPRRGRANFERNDWVTALLSGLGGCAIRYRWAVLSAAGAICLFSLWGATRIQVETDYIEFLSRSNPIRVENARITERLGGTQPVYVVVDAGERGSVRDLGVLSAMRDLQEFIDEQPDVDASLSLVDYLTIAREVLNPDAPRGLPAAQSEVNQLLVLVDSKDLRPVVAPDFSKANIVVGTQLSGSREVSAFVERVERYARTRFRRGIEVRATGVVVLLNRTADTLARAQLTGLLQVLGVLFVLMSVLLLSARAGAMSLVPNVIPIIVLFGVMGWGGITLNVSTSMIAVIAIGIAVDDTIHYLSAFNSQIRQSGSESHAILHVGRSVGLAIVFTSIALAVGFLVVCMSNFLPIRHFGILASATMVVALFADLLLMPALLMTAHMITLWDLLYVKLGPQPHKEIRLFGGLRPFQAKIVVLMSKLARAGPGDFITRRGELREELYVILTGRVDVCRVEDKQVLRSCSRGDVIGEMGLVRHQPRSADVVVATDTEYLVLDAAFLTRIQRRYPRIAATVFLNLTQILSDRLESTTDQLVVASRQSAGA